MTQGLPQTDLTHEPIAEKSRKVITATLKDEDDAAIALANLDTITVTLYEESTGNIINSRSAQSIKNANGGTVHATSGLVTLILGPDDNVFADPNALGRSSEIHLALFEWSYNGDATAVGKHRVRLKIADLLKVT